MLRLPDAVLHEIVSVVVCDDGFTSKAKDRMLVMNNLKRTCKTLRRITQEETVRRKKMLFSIMRELADEVPSFLPLSKLIFQPEDPSIFIMDSDDRLLIGIYDSGISIFFENMKHFEHGIFATPRNRDSGLVRLNHKEILGYRVPLAKIIQTWLISCCKERA